VYGVQLRVSTIGLVEEIISIVFWKDCIFVRHSFGELIDGSGPGWKPLG
jgi:hypothetical protein